MSNKIDRLLNEKYRPKTIDDYVFQDESVERKMRRWVNKGVIPNVLLIGHQGTGKTTAAWMLIEELGIDLNDVMVLNGSTIKLDDVRDDIQNWTKISSFSKFKIVVIEEVDALPKKAQQALRMITEETSDTVRWIFTANYESGIIGPLLSRFEAGYIRLDQMSYDGVLDFIVNIVAQENIEIAEDEVLLAHIDKHQPDIRKIINSIEGSLDQNNVLHYPKGSGSLGEVEEWRELWSTGNVTLDKCLDLTINIDQTNYQWFYQTMYENSKHFPSEGKGVVLCSQYLDRAMTSANQRLHLDAFLYELFMEDE